MSSITFDSDDEIRVMPSSVSAAASKRRISWVWIRVFPARIRAEMGPRTEQEGPR